ncbi:MAG: HD domain-containing protein [Candidatus Pacebacteria bacterium]|mgnify:CR=1 FL=1|jgi:GTP pyrophosphokinase|nr:HD domain-containing protein [Candidatus Paceibacterota bacterium]|tara:strand:- start:28590 stop:30167 length:1578 start_codon:yes stop_codon:yes gene_type:complete
MSTKDIISLMDSPTGADKEFITKAYKFAEHAHKDQRRNSRDLYIVHLCETAKILAGLGMGVKTVAAGLLHDTIEDVGVTEEQLRKKFGDEILYLVQGVTGLGMLRYRGQKKHAESLRKLFVVTSQDIRILIIKLADRLHNMRTLQYNNKESQKRNALETLEIYAQIADRLGMGQMKGELEDLAFPYVYPDKYQEVRKLRKQRGKETLKRLVKIDKSLKKELAKNEIINFRTDYRMKQLYSLYQKLERKEHNIEKIRDISALRIIVPTVSDCYKILGIIHGLWRPLPGEIKDYIAFPRPNGYRSLHTTIFTGDGGIIEIQIRTEEMHKESEYGIASHISYKGGLEGKRKKTNLLWFRDLFSSRIRGRIKQFQDKRAEKKIKKKSTKKQRENAYEKPKYSISKVPAWIKQIAEEQKSVPESEEFLEDLKSDFFSHRVFVFTPKGDVIDLPADSSPIDFAYAVHSDIGNHVFGTKVNDKLVSLDTKLKNGDIVEIETKESSHPTRKWLDTAKTSVAQRHIRSAITKKD